MFLLLIVPKLRLIFERIVTKDTQKQKLIKLLIVLKAGIATFLHESIHINVAFL